MENKLFREYHFKFYLNANHSIVIDGKQGQTHPHTWEFGLRILIQREGFVEFNVFEKEVERFFEQYQNTNLNAQSPFDITTPILENMVEYFGEEIRHLIKEIGGELIQIEGSETPTRSYCISYEQDPEYLRGLEKLSRESISAVLDRLLDNLVLQGEYRE